MKIIPIGNEWDFLNEVALNSGSTITFGPPGDIINITKGVNEHDMGVRPLIGKIGNDIN